MADDVVRVKLYVSTGFVGANYDDEIEIPRDEWDEMTPTERRARLDDEADEFMWERIERGWEIDDAGDQAATEDEE